MSIYYPVLNFMQMLRDAGFDEVIAEDRTDQVCTNVLCTCILDGCVYEDALFGPDYPN